ncbi:hypothetical protein BH24GEM2_BH24GEM2_02880 [soil metagenome]
MEDLSECAVLAHAEAVAANVDDVAVMHQLLGTHVILARALCHVDGCLRELGPRFEAMYAQTGQPSVPPEQLLRALLVQVLDSVRSERLLVEQLDYNLLFRWFVGLGMDEPVWTATTFSKNRDRLLGGEVAHAFFAAVVEQARTRALLSADHFTVDGHAAGSVGQPEELPAEGRFGG